MPSVRLNWLDKTSVRPLGLNWFLEFFKAEYGRMDDLQLRIWTHEYAASLPQPCPIWDPAIRSKSIPFAARYRRSIPFIGDRGPIIYFSNTIRDSTIQNGDMSLDDNSMLASSAARPIPNNVPPGGAIIPDDVWVKALPFRWQSATGFWSCWLVVTCTIRHQTDRIVHSAIGVLTCKADKHRMVRNPLILAVFR